VELSDQVAIVTGAGQGIGKAAALALAAAGADVVASDINGASAEETAAAIASNGPRAHAIQVDVGNTQASTASYARRSRASARSTYW